MTNPILDLATKGMIVMSLGFDSFYSGAGAKECMV